MFRRFIHWLIFISIVLGVIGAIIQLIRWGAITESGSIGPTGY